MIGNGKMRAAIFDLDGVLVDTAKHHFLAWRRLADELGFVFTEHDNERLKGVGRAESVSILLEVGGLNFDAEVRAMLAERKNRWYVERLHGLSEADLLPGSLQTLATLRQTGIPIVLASASKNAKLALDRLCIADYFAAVIDGNAIARSKPDPEIFLRAAATAGCPPEQCVVFEDAAAGIAAAHAAGMYAVGIGGRHNLAAADMIVPNLSQCDLMQLFELPMKPC